MTDRLALERFADELVAFARALGDDDRRAARRCLADAIACASVGVDTDAHRRSAAAFDDWPAAPNRQATIWFTGASGSALAAAYLNSLAISAHDLDDGNRAAVGHPAGAVIPAVVAELETSSTSVDPLDAIAFGYEAGLRLAALRVPSTVPTMATGRWAGFASAAVSCFIAGDANDVLAHALGHAGSLAPQLAPPDARRVDGLKEGTPWGVVTGLMAARLARAGIPSPTYLLERHHDFDALDLDALKAGPTAAIHESYFKRYGCCRWIHPAIDAILALNSENHFVLDEIEKIEIKTFSRSRTLSNLAAPTTIEEAHYSFPFCIALSLTSGPGALLPIRSDALRSERTQRLAHRVELVIDHVLDDQFPAFTPAVVRVTTSAGTRELATPTAQGDPSLPFPAAVLRDKHRRLLGNTGVDSALHADPFHLAELLKLLGKAPVRT